MKTCRCCGVEKDLTEFHKAKQNKDGHKGACKPCNILLSKKYAEDNKEKVSKTQSDWWFKNKERLTEYHKKHYLQNKERHLASTRAWAKANPEKVKFMAAKSRAKNREYIRQRTRENYILNKDAIQKQRRIYINENRERLNRCRREKYHENANLSRAKGKRWSAMAREKLGDGYIKQLIIGKTDLNADQIPDSFIELKRVQVKILRETGHWRTKND